MSKMFRVCFPFLLLLLWEARVSAKPQDDRNCRSLASAGYRFWSHYHFPKWSRYDTVWTDWAIFCTLGNHSKLVAKIILPKSPTLLGYFCKIVKSIHFSIEIIFGQLLQTFGDFYLVTLVRHELQIRLHTLM